jgi:hypothetical protein
MALAHPGFGVPNEPDVFSLRSVLPDVSLELALRWGCHRGLGYLSK